MNQRIVRFATVTGRPIIPTTLYTVNHRNHPFFSEWRQVAPGELAIRYPKEVPFGIAALWEVPGFGRVIVTADDEGRHYRLGEGAPLDFRAEAAKSKAARVRRRLSELAQGGDASPEGLVERVEAASRRLRALNLAPAGSVATAGLLGEGTTMRPEASSGGESPRSEGIARALDEILSSLFWAGEEIELAKARADIARMSRQERRIKLFGSSFFDPSAPQAYLHRFAELFNFATIPFYRRQVEPVEGEPDWATRDRLLDWLDEQGIARKGHPLSWWIEHGLPDWMKRLSYKTLKEVVYRQVFETVSRYKERVKTWDVINEAHDPIVKGNDLNLSRDQVFEITELACRATREADPEAVRILNINRPWGVYRSEWEMMDPMHAIEYLEELADRGIEYEIIGVQNYHGGPEHYVHDMADQSALIDRYLALGKPVHITEVQTPSSMETDPSKWLGGRVAPSGWWHRPWDPEVQADWAEQFYTIAASKAGLGAITWWDLSDRRTFWPHGGLLDEHDQPKPAYYRIRQFVRAFRGEEPGGFADSSEG